MKKQLLILLFCTSQLLLSMEKQGSEKIYSLQECCLRAIATNYASQFSKHMPELQEIITLFPTITFKQKFLGFLHTIINKESPYHTSAFLPAAQLTWLKFYCCKQLLAYVGSLSYFKDDTALITQNNSFFYYSHTIPFTFNAPIQCAAASILDERGVLAFAQDKSLLIKDDKTELIDCSDSAITSLAFSSHLIIGYGNENGQIHLFDRSLQGFWQKIKTMAFNKTKITALAISPCTHYVIACDEEGTASFHGNATHTELNQYSYCLAKETPIEYCIVSPNGLLVGLQQKNSTFLLFNLSRLMRGVYPYYFIIDERKIAIGKLLSFTQGNNLIIENNKKLTLHDEDGNYLKDLESPENVIEFHAMPFHCRTQDATYIPAYKNI